MMDGSDEHVGLTGREAFGIPEELGLVVDRLGKPGDHVLDPLACTDTSLHPAHELGRVAIGGARRLVVAAQRIGPPRRVIQAELTARVLAALPKVDLSFTRPPCCSR